MDKIRLVTFLEERYLDYEDFDEPFKIRTTVVNDIDGFINWAPNRVDVKAQLNQITLKDKPLINPWANTGGSKSDYLALSTKSEKANYGDHLYLSLSDKKVIR
jgi:hypothetical protein